MVEQHRSLRNKSRPNPVQQLNIELLFAVQVDKAHREARRTFSDALYIRVIVLLRLLHRDEHTPATSAGPLVPVTCARDVERRSTLPLL